MKTNYINCLGITSSTASIYRNVCVKNEYYVDMLEDGLFLVSYHNTKIGLFSEIGEAMFFFMSKSEPIPGATVEEKMEALNWLDSQLNR